MADRLSDKAIAVFAFAAYHQLTSGKAVREVVLKDDAGHTADQDAVHELETAKLLTVNGEWGAFTDTGEALFAKVIGSLQACGDR